MNKEHCLLSLLSDSFWPDIFFSVARFTIYTHWQISHLRENEVLGSGGKTKILSLSVGIVIGIHQKYNLREKFESAFCKIFLSIFAGFV